MWCGEPWCLFVEEKSSLKFHKVWWLKMTAYVGEKLNEWCKRSKIEEKHSPRMWKLKSCSESGFGRFCKEESCSTFTVQETFACIYRRYSLMLTESLIFSWYLQFFAWMRCWFCSFILVFLRQVPWRRLENGG